MIAGPLHTYRFIGILAVILVVMYWPLFAGQTTLQGETADLLFSVFSHIQEAWAQGEWPLWNKYQYQGLPTLYFPLYWNPLILTFAWVFPDPASSLNALYLTVVFIASIGFYKFCGGWVHDEKTALIGGLSYALAGFFVVQSAQIGILTTAAFLPLLFYHNDWYHKTGKFVHLLHTGLAYFLLITMTGPGFVWIVSGLLIAQLWVNRNHQSLRQTGEKTAALVCTFLMGGFLVWRIYWERWLHHHPAIIEDATADPIQFLSGMASFVLSKTTTTPEFHAGWTGFHSFHFYIGIILLILVPISLLYRRNHRDVQLAVAGLCFMVLAFLGVAVSGEGLGYAGMRGSAFSTTMAILLVISLLILGLRGLEKACQGPSSVKYLFLLSSLLFAGAGYYMGSDTQPFTESDLLAWYIHIDCWKSALFLLFAALALWIRKPAWAFAVVGICIVTDLSISTYLNQDQTLYRDDFSVLKPIFIGQNPEPIININQPVGLHSDDDFAIGDLHRNTGTLTQQMVRDGYWPWLPNTHLPDTLPDYQVAAGRYPVFYFSRDTSGGAIPTVTNLDDVVHIRVQQDHRWELSVFHHYEKFLVFNQNFDPNWHAMVDGLHIPIQRTRFGRMQIPLPAGIHTVTLEYQHEGLPHIFIVTMGLLFLLILFQVRNRAISWSMLTVALPALLTLLISPIGKSQNAQVEDAPPIQQADTAAYLMDYEKRAEDWFVRADQITPLDSRSGYRSEFFDQDAVYSATLQLHRAALADKTGFQYRFRIKSSKAVDIGVVLKTYTADDESYNIDYIRSLDIGEWNTVEGRFELDSAAGSLIRAEWYIWNHKAQEFLIDDIEIKLNP